MNDPDVSWRNHGVDPYYLTLGFAHLFCQVCQVRAERVDENLQPYRIRCPKCWIMGMRDEVLDKATIYALYEIDLNFRRASLSPNPPKDGV